MKIGDRIINNIGLLMNWNMVCCGRGGGGKFIKIGTDDGG